MINDAQLKKDTLNLLEKRGINLEAIAEIALEAQIKYNPNLTLDYAKECLNKILNKREVQLTILTGLSIDIACEQGAFDDTVLGGIIRRDEGLYGIDEALALSITDVYGSIAKCNFGYFDITKPGIIGKLNDKMKNGRVNTYADDLVAALCGATCARLGHNVSI